jgi:hypothetical protein
MSKLFRLATVPLLLFAMGAFFWYNDFIERRDFDDAMDHGVEVIGDITGILVPTGPSGSTSKAISLAWTDKSGQRRAYGQTGISEKFFRQISKDGEQTVQQTKIRYLEDRRDARPIILNDQVNAEFQRGLGQYVGPLFVFFGLVASVSAMRQGLRS